jgi:hypothetical protein
MFNCYGNVDELMGLYNVGCFRHINGFCIYFLTRKLPPTSKGEVEDGRHVDTNIRKDKAIRQRSYYPYLGLNLIVGVTQQHLETQRYFLHMSHVHVITKSKISNGGIYHYWCGGYYA